MSGILRRNKILVLEEEGMVATGDLEEAKLCVKIRLRLLTTEQTSVRKV